MLKRNNKRICIVEAKKDRMEQEMVQDLIGMEVVSDLDGLDCVYGIVTNYVEWIFLKSHNDKIEKDVDTLQFELGVATVESLKRIAGKIYAMLSDD
jgi:galactitol-specific phosphotransferase system IIC component